MGIGVNPTSTLQATSSSLSQAQYEDQLTRFRADFEERNAKQKEELQADYERKIVRLQEQLQTENAERLRLMHELMMTKVAMMMQSGGGPFTGGLSPTQSSIPTVHFSIGEDMTASPATPSTRLVRDEDYAGDPS